ncbi:MAG: subclass B3 metallo-beta-lactamase [Proteobacteria bacterium]|uniref:subclass B3 metallo-beta-lactamase n=1 Tax=Rudaea sp. TaxID=2136325 RepID=UPI001D417991|nr:subclass B3 metallo-beta-lactamase [Pseudomonadota bacterium]MBS0567497.1 subclass B3 metallo-beta-lactamase [Pseudomonadota bacterium]
MPNAFSIVFLGTLALSTAPADSPDPLTRPMPGKPEWTRAHAPIRIYGNTYYVGSEGISALLVDTGAGLILLDVGLPQSAPLVEANIAKLGFKLKDIKYVLNSHAHFDHAGGIAALVRDSGATAIASPSGAKALREGHVAADDPQASDTADATFPAAARVREIADGEAMRLGDTAITAHFTPGHTPGSTTWTWKSCENGTCLDVVYSDSISAYASDGFHFLADATHGDLTASFRKSIHTVANLPCDILVSTHLEASGSDARLAKLALRREPNPMIDTQACRRFAADYEKMLDERIAKEKTEAQAR